MLKKTGVGFILVALMLVVALPACRQGNKDLKGMDIVIGNYWENWDAEKGSSQWPGGKPRNEVDELEMEWRRNIQKDYNFTMRAKQVTDWSQMLMTAVTSIMAKKPAAHVFFLQPDWAMTLYRSGLIYPISDSKAVNFKTDTPIVGTRRVFFLTNGFYGRRALIPIFPMICR